MFRGGIVETFPEWYYDASWADWPLYILHAQRGKIGYLDEVLGAWRIHNQGMWSGLSNTQMVDQTVEFYKQIMPYLETGQQVIVQGRISHWATRRVRKYRKRLRRKRIQLKELEEALAGERQKVQRLRRRNRRLVQRVRALEDRTQNGVARRIRSVLRRVGRLRGKAANMDE